MSALHLFFLDAMMLDIYNTGHKSYRWQSTKTEQ